MKDSTKLDDLTFSAMYNIMQSGMWILNDLESYLRPLGMSQARLTVLLMLQEETGKVLKAKDIARTTGKSKPAITRMIEKLSEEGLVLVEGDDTDGRAKRLMLSEEGARLLEKIIPEYNERVRIMSAKFSTGDKLQLNRLLKQISFFDEEKVLL